MRHTLTVSIRRRLAAAALLAPLVVACLSAGTAPAAEVSLLDLSGPWRFRLDPDKIGISEKWYGVRLPGEIRLPGTTDEAKLGLKNPAKPSLDGLYRPNVYSGAAWYQRDVEIPAEWKGRHVQLLLERAHWETRVWLDNTEIGLKDSLIAPHVHDIGAGIPAGKHTLTICVDNTLKFNLGRFVSIHYEGTQTNWNGIIGRIELRAVPETWIDSQSVRTKNDGSVTIDVHVRNTRFDPVGGTITAVVVEKATGKTVGRGSAEFSYARGLTTDHRHIFTMRAVERIALKLDGPPRLWSEFQPDLYEVRTRLAVEGHPEDVSTRTTTFGFRELEIRGTQFFLNGRPLFLRGTLECAIFPLTGYPPTDVPSWQRIYRVLKSHGLNFLRFHSWCPPEAAFAAADIEGVYLQPEGPEANIHIDREAPIGKFMEGELLRIVREYGNHPSFLLMTLGNEHHGRGDTLDYWVRMLREEDPRHCYSSASSGQATPSRQFTEGGPRGVQGPRTDADFRAAVAKADRPLVGHEIGQWTFFPNFDEIPKYRGVLEARNFELVRDDLAGKHILDQAAQFFQATGRHAVLLYKEEIEILLRTPKYPGFSLLDLHDYPGQGTALIGPLDPFWDSKGFVSPEEHARYCGPTVPLVRLKNRTFTSDETLTAEAEIAHFGPRDLAAAVPQWSLRDGQGRAVASGAMPARDIPAGQLVPLGSIEAPLAAARVPGKLTLSLAIEGTPLKNEWEIWVYPPTVNIEPPKGLLVTKGWNDEAKAALAGGGRVLMFVPSQAKHTFAGRFLPVFWSPIWFPSQRPNTMGILCDPKHPALADFPTEFHSNWQWCELLDQSRTVILDETPPEFRPVVQVIDNFARNHRLGVVFEAKVGAGRLLVCGIDLPGLAEKRPAARQLLASLLRYAGSDGFDPGPKLALSAETLDALFGHGAGGAMQRLGAKVVEADSQHPDHPAANVLDGDAETIWHTPWGGERPAAFPHRLVIELARPVMVAGLKVLPRQDMRNGWIKEYEVYVSGDGKEWGQAVGKGRFAATSALQTIRFDRPVQAKYLKFVAVSPFKEDVYASMAELEVVVEQGGGGR